MQAVWVVAALVLGAQGRGGEAPVPAAGAKLDRGLEEFAGRKEVFVRFRGQLLPKAGAFEAFCAQRRGADRRKLRREVLAKLHESSDRGFAALAPLIRRLERQGALEAVRRYWIVAGFAARATEAACRALAARPEVEFIYAKPVRGLPSLCARPPRARKIGDAARKERRTLLEHALELAAAAPRFDPKAVAAAWHLKRLHVPEAWAAGCTGRGVVIAVLDTGLLPVPELLRALWRNPHETLDGKDEDGDGRIDDLFGWDFLRGDGFVFTDDPRRPLSHGTACAGILASRPVEDGGRRLAVSVAPEARLMILRGMGRLEAYEYALAKGADVLSMSYMWVNLPLGNWRGLYRLAHEHLAAAGVVAAGGAGNFGRGSRRRAPRYRRIALPKDIPCVLASAGILRDGRKAPPSSEGPCLWEDVVFYGDHPRADPLKKPDVTAFFTGFPVWVPIRRRLWRRVGWRAVVEKRPFALAEGPAGNSFSGPQAAGIAALVLSAAPELPAWVVEDCLRRTCRDLGPKGWDPEFGWGLLDAAAACREARRRREERG